MGPVEEPPEMGTAIDQKTKDDKNIYIYSTSFSCDILFCGNLETIKYLFNHPEVRHKSKKSLQPSMKEDRMLEPRHVIHVVCFEPQVYIINLLLKLRFWSAQEGLGWNRDATYIEHFVTLGLGNLVWKKRSMRRLGCPWKRSINLKEIHFTNQFNLPIVNALWRVTVGQQFYYDNLRLIFIIHKLTDLLKRARDPSAIMIILAPWATKIYPCQTMTSWAWWRRASRSMRKAWIQTSQETSRTRCW